MRMEVHISLTEKKKLKFNALSNPQSSTYI